MLLTEFAPIGFKHLPKERLGLLVGQDVFLARYDSAGNRVWISQFGSSENDYALALAPAGAGGVMVAGYTHGSLGGPNAGGRDVFLARYPLWNRQFGTSSDDVAYALAPDGAGGVMVAGYTGGSLGGPNADRNDAFLARFSFFDRGDLNCDGVFNGADIDPFFLALGDPAVYAAQFPNCDPLLGDMNRDDRLDGANIDPFFFCLGGNCP